MQDLLLILETDMKAYWELCHKAVHIVRIVQIFFYFIAQDICLS